MSAGKNVPAVITDAFVQYQTLLQCTGAHQARWNATIKEFIYQCLSELASSPKPLKAIKDESVRNFDTVCVGFIPSPTNIVIKIGQGAQGLTKFGGFLFYSQVYNGKVLVGISYPYVEKLQDQVPNKGLALLDPEEITEIKILEHVELFLKELFKNESSPSMEEELKRRGTIGFGSGILTSVAESHAAPTDPAA